MALRGKTIGFDKAKLGIAAALGIHRWKSPHRWFRWSTPWSPRWRRNRCPVPGACNGWYHDVWSCVKDSVTGNCRRMKTRRRTIAKSSSIAAHSWFCLGCDTFKKSELCQWLIHFRESVCWFLLVGWTWIFCIVHPQWTCWRSRDGWVRCVFFFVYIVCDAYSIGCGPSIGCTIPECMA